MLDYRRNVEKALEEKIRAIVGRIVWSGAVEAKVEVELGLYREDTDYFCYRSG